jgi:thiamine biosynthesis lipoprotein
LTVELLTEYRRSLRVMGCSASITVVGGEPGLLDRAVARLADLEARWSRFREDSDITRVNRAAGRAVEVDAATVELVSHLVQAWWATGGAFDPTLLPLTVQLGDAVSWVDAARVTSLADGSRGPGDPAGIGVDAARCLVQVPAGTALDAGGLGKGLAADMVVEDLLASGAVGALVVVGGDVRVGGEHPDGAWTVAVEDPFVGERELTRIGLCAGGVATSSTRWRRWEVDGQEHHHLLDPATGRPTPGTIVAATVVAGTAAWAEAWTKAVMVRGPEHVLAELDALGLAALAVGADGSVITNDAWKELE